MATITRQRFLRGRVEGGRWKVAPRRRQARTLLSVVCLRYVCVVSLQFTLYTHMYIQYTIAITTHCVASSSPPTSRLRFFFFPSSSPSPANRCHPNFPPFWQPNHLPIYRSRLYVGGRRIKGGHFHSLDPRRRGREPAGRSEQCHVAYAKVPLGAAVAAFTAAATAAHCRCSLPIQSLSPSPLVQ